jgi:hypothetical protein
MCLPGTDKKDYPFHLKNKFFYLQCNCFCGTVLFCTLLSTFIFIFSYCDFFGEKLAWFFGITSPKYYYELQEFRREQEREEERKEKEDIEIRKGGLTI